MNMRLLTYVLLLVATLAAWPAHAQESLVAAIITGNLERYQAVHRAFENKLLALGLDPQKVKIYVQVPNPDPGSWKNSIRKAIGIGADIIVTYGAPTTLSALAETEKVPIIYGDFYDPVGLGIASETHIPLKKNATGAASNTPMETLIKTYVQIQQPKRIGILVSEFDQGSMQQMRELERLGFKYHFTVEMREVKTPGQVMPAMEELLKQVDALFASDNPLFQLRVDEVMARAQQGGIPVISQIPGLCDRGALIGLEADPTEQGEHVAEAVQLLLEGKKVAYIPVHFPKRVSLAVNVGVARERKLLVPFQVLSTATRILK